MRTHGLKPHRDLVNLLSLAVSITYTKDDFRQQCAITFIFQFNGKGLYWLESFKTSIVKASKCSLFHIRQRFRSESGNSFWQSSDNDFYWGDFLKFIKIWLTWYFKQFFFMIYDQYIFSDANITLSFDLLDSRIHSEEMVHVNSTK